MTCTFKYKNKKGEVVVAEVTATTAGLSLLDEAESVGLVPAYGCRAGSCGACRVTVNEGLELLGPRGIVEEDTWLRCQDPPEVRLACRAELLPNAHGTVAFERAPDVTVEFDDER